MKHQKLIVSSVILFAISSFMSCSKNESNPTPQPTIGVQLATNPTLGKILTDSAGNTLYFFSNDPKGTSSCNAGCLAAWPIFYTANATLASGLVDTDFAVITRTDGLKQTTYKGWPLYYYMSDAKPGDVNGEAVNGVWFVAKPDYTVMLAKGPLVGKDSVAYTSQYQPGNENVIYLTDDWGRTLYAFSPDHFNSNHFTKPDFSNNAVWPIYEKDTAENIPSSLSKADFSKTDVFGKKQLTFKGWPLYYFGPDEMIRGNTKGVSVPVPGVWPIVNNSSTVAPD